MNKKTIAILLISIALTTGLAGCIGNPSKNGPNEENNKDQELSPTILPKNLIDYELSRLVTEENATDTTEIIHLNSPGYIESEVGGYQVDENKTIVVYASVFEEPEMAKTNITRLVNVFQTPLNVTNTTISGYTVYKVEDNPKRLLWSAEDVAYLVNYPAEMDVSHNNLVNEINTAE